MAGKSLLAGLSPERVAARIKFFWAIFKAPQIGCIIKTIMILGVLYVLSPFDFWMFNLVDDVIVIYLIGYLLPEFLPRDVIDPLKDETGVR